MRKSYVNLFLVSFFALSIELTSEPLKAQTTVWVPAQKAVVPVPSYYCRIRIETIGGRYYAGRTLDSNGNMIGDSISWQSHKITDPNAVITEQIRWWSENAPHSFETGMLNLYFRGNEAMTYYLRLELKSHLTNKSTHFDAGPSASATDKTASTYIRLDKVLKVAGDVSSLGYRLARLKKYQGTYKNTALEGQIDLSPILSAQSHFSEIEPKLVELQKEYQKNCSRQ